MKDTPSDREEELREKFYKYALKDEIDDLSFHELLEETADWWLEILSQERNRIAEEIKSLKYIEAVMPGPNSSQRLAEKQYHNAVIDKVLSLITNKK